MRARGGSSRRGRAAAVRRALRPGTPAGSTPRVAKRPARRSRHSLRGSRCQLPVDRRSCSHL